MFNMHDNLKMANDLKSRIDHCYALAENGSTELAKAGLQSYVKKFCDELHKNGQNSFLDADSVIKSIERTSHRIGIDVALQYAEDFYEKRENSKARGWLDYGKWHAKQIGLNIGEQISEIKRKYSDRMPLIF